MSSNKEKTIAQYIMAGLPVPEHLKRQLIEELCEEYKKGRERTKDTSSPISVVGV